MTPEHDEFCEQRATLRWVGCKCAQRATGEVIEEWVAECRKSA